MNPPSPVGDELPEGATKAAAVEDMFDRIAPRYDLVNRLMTFRLDVRWRRRTVRELGLDPGSVVLDLACGTGDLCNDLQRARLRAVGADFSAGMLAASRTTAPLVRADALRLPVPDLQGFFGELGRVVRPGGRIGLLDVAEPRSRVLRLGHGVYFGRIVPRIGALLSDGAAYRYLPRSVEYLPEPEVMMGWLRDAGFPDATRTLLSGGITQMLLGTRSEP
jgi:demethylmenaquinone methyltransferase/2-methoxy-6-polyprenyl-1,4-benzoquinol methylase